MIDEELPPDNFEQLYKNQLEINESLQSHIADLNKMVDEQLCIPDVKWTQCDKCSFKKRWMERAIDENSL
jgi:hypothetical protein